MGRKDVPLPSRSTGLPLLLPMAKGEGLADCGLLELEGMRRRRKGRGERERDYREARDQDSDSTMFGRVGCWWC